MSYRLFRKGLTEAQANRLAVGYKNAEIKDRLVETRAELWVRVYVHAVTTDNVHDPEAAGARADTAVAVFNRRFLLADPFPTADEPVKQTTVEGE